ncbi:MAG TPA: DUF3540 domain-containing protein [Candidatus Eisenbacteria bacterium]
MEAQEHQILTVPNGGQELAPAPGLILGPAVVRGVMDGALLVEHEGSLERATMALAYPYRAVTGDVVLILGQEDRFYVTGVLDGQGMTRLDFPGDAELRAAGTLRLSAAEGVELDSQRISMRAEKLDMTIASIRQQVASFYQHVTGTLRTIAGRQRTHVEKESTLHARKIVRKAEDDVIVDGRQIKLG